ncbi:MAG: polysaccharide biosynthesis protein [Nitrospira sp.]|nr:polysaccharide biosynthesis protein [Nitrospira sp.]
MIGSALVFYAFVSWIMGFADYPRSVFIVDSILMVGFLLGVRLPSRVLNEAAIFRKNKRVLVVGAGDPGERVVREMKTRSEFHCTPIGFVGEHVGLLNQRIHGVKVLGTLGDLPKLVEELKPEMVVVAVPNPTPVFLRDLIAKLEPYEVSLKTLPGQDELMVDRSTVSQIRNISIPDLLPRGQVNLVTDAMRQMVKGKGVMITGAGGSIGSELARQVSSLEPRVLLLYERHENSLYHIHKELEDSGFAFPIIPFIGDITDAQRLCMVLEQHRPQILFHAAAHKHVPLVELNPVEAVKNNCIGTRIVAESASLYGVEQFVHISTDKAVNPSSVMGATKRVAELIIQNIAQTSQTRFILVRFGNVLGSSGSVVLRFQEQIRSGGPVTVTHPEICRFFMLIPEAVQLVLQAATIGEQGQIYILDMGEQVKVLDLARSLIRLCGFVPDRDIPIRFVGLRPGEKLYEELVGEGEVPVGSPSEKILQICTPSLSDFESFRGRLSSLEAESFRGEAHVVLERLREIVPTLNSPSGVETSIMPVSNNADMK